MVAPRKRETPSAEEPTELEPSRLTTSATTANAAEHVLKHNYNHDDSNIHCG